MSSQLRYNEFFQTQVRQNSNFYRHNPIFHIFFPFLILKNPMRNASFNVELTWNTMTYSLRIDSTCILYTHWGAAQLCWPVFSQQLYCWEIIKESYGYQRVGNHITKDKQVSTAMSYIFLRSSWKVLIWVCAFFLTLWSAKSCFRGSKELLQGVDPSLT